eukprot:1385582-Amphidinium_carterae.1
MENFWVWGYNSRFQGQRHHSQCQQRLRLLYAFSVHGGLGIAQGPNACSYTTTPDQKTNMRYNNVAKWVVHALESLFRDLGSSWAGRSIFCVLRIDRVAEQSRVHEDDAGCCALVGLQEGQRLLDSPSKSCFEELSHIALLHHSPSQAES